MFIYYEVETETRAKVTTVIYDPDHHMPKPGDLFFEATEVPAAPAAVPGKLHVLYCNPQTGELWYEMVDRPLTKDEEIELLKAEKASLKNDLALLQSAVDDLILNGGAI